MQCLIYQIITSSDGFIQAFYGQEFGRRHDLTLLRQSNWEQQLEKILIVEGEQYYTYGDSALLMRPYMSVPFRRGTATTDELIFNTNTSSLRVSVEWIYKDLKHQ